MQQCGWLTPTSRCGSRNDCVPLHFHITRDPEPLHSASGSDFFRGVVMKRTDYFIRCSCGRRSAGGGASTDSSRGASETNADFFREERTWRLPRNYLSEPWGFTDFFGAPSISLLVSSGVKVDGSMANNSSGLISTEGRGWGKKSKSRHCDQAT